MTIDTGTATGDTIQLHDSTGSQITTGAGSDTVQLTGNANDGDFQAFIPDKGNDPMRHLCRSTADGNTQWTDLAEMKGVQ